MKAKTSVTLSEELLAEMDRLVGAKANRSAFLETAAWAQIDRLNRQRRNARDRKILDRESRSLSREALEVLEFQADL